MPSRPTTLSKQKTISCFLKGSKTSTLSGKIIKSSSAKFKLDVLEKKSTILKKASEKPQKEALTARKTTLLDRIRAKQAEKEKIPILTPRERLEKLAFSKLPAIVDALYLYVFSMIQALT
ncbi:hypothetical protein NEOLI_003297 [Neolecta irregularis DAH-3]|uniref:Uncharacterized protein n=1 Tax=Neolecta irregularis (strain DAH-3) TaxID=1198029 RepID=A0A1U7LRN9_NEOID|nr:hypothetical protein NEOLI_003297 [Neolecta irregularis DAH-3]|eukprot:OLL25336.1 hypothetical protein NEOLI_003297 [Neolecta irregularis DAH-3]